MNSNDIISVADQWIGTPFHEQGRQKSVGCDCIGLILGVAKEVGAISLTNQPWDQCYVHAYDPLTDSQLLVELMPKYFMEVPIFPGIKISPQPGDILLIQITQNQYHLSIQSYNNRIIHSCSSIGRVICHKFIPTWKVIKIFSYGKKCNS